MTSEDLHCHVPFHRQGDVIPALGHYLVQPVCDRRDRLNGHNLRWRLNVEELGLSCHLAMLTVGKPETSDQDVYKRQSPD